MSVARLEELLLAPAVFQGDLLIQIVVLAVLITVVPVLP